PCSPARTAAASRRFIESAYQARGASRANWILPPRGKLLQCRNAHRGTRCGTELRSADYRGLRRRVAARAVSRRVVPLAGDEPLRAKRALLLDEPEAAL